MSDRIRQRAIAVVWDLKGAINVAVWFVIMARGGR